MIKILSRCPNCGGRTKHNKLQLGKRLCKDCFNNFDPKDCLVYRCTIHPNFITKEYKPCPECIEDKKIFRIERMYIDLIKNYKKIIGD